MTTESRVHPSSADAPAPSILSPVSSPNRPTDGQMPSKHVSPPKTYVVQFPREQILRYPPPENERKFKNLVLRKKQQRSCCCCSACFLLLLIVAMIISAGLLYLVYRFDSQKYTVVDLNIKGMNLNSSSPISPEFDLAMRIENPNEKVGIYYLKDGVVSVSYNGYELSDGVFPMLTQLKNNVTLLQIMTLKRSDVVLERTVRTNLMKSESEGSVGLLVKLRVPVKFKLGSVKTWNFSIRVWCHVVVDALNQTAIIISQDCLYRTSCLW